MPATSSRGNNQQGDVERYVIPPRTVFLGNNVCLTRHRFAIRSMCVVRTFHLLLVRGRDSSGYRRQLICLLHHHLLVQRFFLKSTRTRRTMYIHVCMLGSLGRSRFRAMAVRAIVSTSNRLFRRRFIIVSSYYNEEKKGYVTIVIIRRALPVLKTRAFFVLTTAADQTSFPVSRENMKVWKTESILTLTVVTRNEMTDYKI